MKEHYDEGGLERELVTLNNHSLIYHIAVDFNVPSFAPKEWLTKCVWKLVDANTMIIGYEDAEDDNYPMAPERST